MRSPVAIIELSAHRALSTLPEVWLDLAHGRLSAHEAAAAMEGREPAELVERSTALFLPPSAADEERRLAALLQAHFPAPARRRRPRWVTAGVTALLAASLVLVIAELRPPPAFEGGYSLRLSSGYLEERAEPGAAQGPVRYHEDQRVELVLRPAHAVDEDVGVVAFASGSGRSLPLRIEPRINAHRVIIIAGTPAAMGLPVGRWELAVVVGPRDHLPSAPEAVRRDADAPYDVLTAEVEIVMLPDPASP